MNATLVISTAIFLTAVYCVHAIRSTFRRGELCECLGSCEECTIQCTSNPLYYGASGLTAEVPQEKEDLRESLRREYFPVFRESLWATALRWVSSVLMLGAVIPFLVILVLTVTGHVYVPQFVCTCGIGILGAVIKELSEKLLRYIRIRRHLHDMISG